MLTFDQALAWANRYYEENRAEFEPDPVKPPSPDEQRRIERNRREAFFQNRDAEYRWQHRHG